MQIKQNQLGTPDYEYTTILKDKNVITRIYHRPQFCIMIETPKNKQVIQLTYEQYKIYCDNAEAILHPNKFTLCLQLTYAKLKADRFEHDANLARFWNNVVTCYRRRINEF